MIHKFNRWLKIKRAFRRWRGPVWGSVSAEDQTNPFWVHAIETKDSGYILNKRFWGKDSFDAGPCWCYDRFGQASVSTPSGVHYSFGGEHEDYYDPDFYIYNDVVVSDGDQLKIYGYPKEEFPSTDFHTATLVGDSIYLIGNLGYPEDRKVGETQILRFDIKSLSFTKVESFGSGPGWISHHTAQYVQERNVIRIQGGQVFGDELVDNCEEFELKLDSMKWEQTSSNNYYQCMIKRVDGESIELFEKRTAAFDNKHGIDCITDWNCSKEQAVLLGRLYCSPDGKTPQEDEDKYNHYLQIIDGVKVLFQEDSFEVFVRVEGKKTQAIEHFINDTKSLIEQIEESECKIQTIHPSYAK